MVDRLNVLIGQLVARTQLRREEGQGAVEYALILAGVAAAVAAGILVLGPAITAKLSGIVF
jgi:Flp pilus assembly pilin Flp